MQKQHDAVWKLLNPISGCHVSCYGRTIAAIPDKWSREKGLVGGAKVEVRESPQLPTRSGGPSAPDRVVEPEASGGGLRLEAVLTIGWGAHDFDATLASHTSIYNSRKLTAPQQR